MDITHLTPDAEGSIEWPSFSNDKKAVVTLGAFDGMHLGHQAVIKRVVELAHQHDAFSVVILFDPRPAFVHGWAASHHGEEPAVQNVDAEALTSVDDRLHRMEQFGVDHVLVVHYTLAFAAMSYIFFLGRLTGKLGMRTLVLGQDAAMGKGREGDVKHIANLAAATGVFELDVVDDRGPGEVRIPRDFKPEAPSEWGEPVDRWPMPPKPSAAHGARRTRPRQCAPGAPPMCATCWLMAESRTPTPFWVLRTPSRAKWCTVRSVAAPSDSPPPILAPTLQATFRGRRRLCRLAGRW